MHFYCLLFLDGFAHHDDNKIMAAGADAITNPGGHNMMTYEGDSLFIYFQYCILLHLLLNANGFITILFELIA
jgi:hypothetical protein